MNQKLQQLLDSIQQSAHLSDDEKNALTKSVQEVDKEIEITTFKLDRTEKVKRTTAILLEETIEELEQKRKAVEAQNRELEIESSLERVRTVAMSMNNPDDMLKVCKTISLQLQSLGVKDIRNVQTAIFYEARGTYMNYEFYAKHDKTFITETLYTNHKIANDFAEKMLKGSGEIYSTSIKGKEVKDWLEYQKTTNVFIDTYLENADSLNYYWHSLGPVALGISTYNPLSEDELNLFQRFLKVFDLSYRRYLDIEKAIAQAKEAQIETSLERVRAQAMAMRTAEELTGICEVLYAELNSLGFKEIRNAMINIHDDENETFVNYDYSDEIGKSINHLTYNIHPLIEKQIKQIRSGDGFSETYYTGKDLEDMITFRKNIGEKDDPRIEQADALYYYFYSIGTGSIGISTFNVVAGEKLVVLKRFRNVFTLAYQRYTDIAQAEAQAKEARIEAALERVRARTMAMQKSTDLADTSALLFQQLNMLVPDLWTCGFVLCDRNKTVDEWWLSGGNGFMPDLILPNVGDPLHNNMYKAWLNDESYYEEVIEGEALQQHYKWLMTIPSANAAFNAQSKAGILQPVWQQLSCAFFSKGYLVVITEKPCGESSIFKRFAQVFEQTYTRFLDLQKAEAQAREAQIEAALERVRSRTMAMQRSEELVDVATVLFQQVKSLGVPQWNCGFNIWNIGDDEFTYYPGSPDGIISPSPCNIPLTEHPVFMRFDESRKRGDDLFVYEKEGKEQADHYRYMLSLPGVGDLLKSMLDSGFELPKFQIDHLANFAYGNLIFITYEHFPEMHEVFKRFAKVFEQTYTRFLDLQKAEAQAREAKIEAALERTRTQSMIMQHSSELDDSLRVFHEQVLLLGIHSAFSFLWLPDEEKDQHKFWAAWAESNSNYFKSKAINYPLDRNEPATKQCLADWKSREPVYSYHVPPAAVENYFAVWKELIDGVEHLKPEYFAGGLCYVEAFMKYGCFGVMVATDLAEDEKKILSRFAIEFERTYTRFLDLQKAEAQAREAEIETALERVRSRSMGMQKSEELKEVIQIVYQQLRHLNIDLDHAGFVVDYTPGGDWHFWIADAQDIPAKISHPYFESVWANQFKEAKEKSTDIFTTHLNFEEKNKFYQELLSYVPGLPETSRDYYLNCPGLAATTVLLEDVGLYIENFTAVPYTDEENKTVLRFGKVFQQTYTRFLDLQKAEAQAREAQIEAALERVRSRTLAMQKSDELAETAAVLFQQLIALGIEPNRLYIAIIKDKKANSEFWITDEDGAKVSTAFTANMHDNATLLKMFEGRDKQKSLILDMQGEELQNYFRYLTSLGVPFKGGLEQKRRVQEIAYFSKGFIGMASPEEQPAETLLLLERFAAVFNLTFTRFNDLKIAEAHADQAEQDLIAIKEAKQKAEDALAELQVTQKQLIQSEKMASLGELTAGIAHEIQNPLNFVNNFSEVSNELIDEMNAEIDKGDMEEAKAIASDIKQNLEKINHHGKRADAIVKGMLQHSRSSTAVKEPTDINKLADEYLRLAYHGLRAKDKSFNATMKTDYDESIGNINIISQDIGRVILNLITNAFYVVDEKKKQNAIGYEPTVTVSTKKINGKVEVTVEDNGNGIPQKVLDKIFQPFFTTKPTGQGTGLGLSLSYDIVKAHGGELKVETKEGEGSEFIIQLPVV